MKKFLPIIPIQTLLCFALFSVSCGKKEGSVSFWTSEINNCGKIRIEINGEYKGQITEGYSGNDDILCNNPKAVKVEFPEGSYSYEASDQCGKWEGNFTITKGDCKSIQLHQ